MKKRLLLMGLLLYSCVNAQNQKYIEVMGAKIERVNTVEQVDSLQWLVNDFIRIGEKEKGEWLPYYYASLIVLKQARLSNGDAKKVDEYLDVATHFIGKTQERKESVEISILEYMYHISRLQVDPKGRYLVNGIAATRYLSLIAEKDPENPRVILMQAMSLLFTPKTFGGDPERAKELFEKVTKHFHDYKIESEISPNWGLAEAEYFLKDM